MGTLHLALRSAQDEATADVSAITVRELLRTANTAQQQHDVAKIVTISEEVPAEPKPASQIAIRTLRGSIRSTMVMRASAASDSVYLEGQPFEGAAPLPPSGEGLTP
jgi:hypothetical protein